ncbi:phosphonate ABC transporter ATP-binding protein [Alkalihalobacillus sp. BA299]|uniref:phosphonate ABC transporter ATP-binding protein n=1 Tax=Alkalihalobacillus sp. BA299 TaxID=2815938 RepID=UPI001ADB0EE8|nr:phosphonate ABC transporter ATP-binding protein [Alkalihalobacillus sp. BA299]
MTLLDVKKVSKVYADGTVALKDVTFQIEKGEFIVVIGPSGAGKSTLLRSINRLVDSTSGEIVFKNEDIMKVRSSKLRKLRREVGMIFQGFNLVERTSVINNVLHGRLGYMNSFKGFFSLFSERDKQEAKQLLHRVGLGSQMYKRADELSGGQQQRVGIARAIAQKPDLILADEPIASLDPVSSETIMEHLYTICQEDGIACLCNLHQVDVAKKYANRIIGIHAGEKVFDGKPEELTDEMIELIYHGTQKENANEKELEKEKEKEMVS